MSSTGNGVVLCGPDAVTEVNPAVYWWERGSETHHGPLDPPVLLWCWSGRLTGSLLVPPAGAVVRRLSAGGVLARGAAVVFGVGALQRSLSQQVTVLEAALPTAELLG